MFRLALFLYISYNSIYVNGEIIVNLPKGKVAGIESVTDTCTPDESNCMEYNYYGFRGMRYANKPNRFERAEPVSPWSGVYNAKVDRATCIQTPASGQIESEDCLFINVYTPKLPSPNTENLTVMFWIYGGAFVQGESLYSEYGPDYFMALQNVVIVTLNYRLGALGFLSDGTSRVPGNLALKDVVLGLQWVQENIAYFGGDPRNVTLFGESAGAVMSSYLLLSPLTQNKGYFRNSIFQSGNALYSWSLQRQPAQVYQKMISALGCNLPFSSSAFQLSCAKNAPLADIRLATLGTFAIDSVVDFGIFNGIPFAPVIEEPSEFAAVTRNTYESLKSGNYPKNIDLLMGGNSEESLIIAPAIPLLRGLLIQIDLNRTLIVPEDMFVKNSNDLQNKVIPTIYSFYFDNKTVTLAPIQNLIKYISGTFFNKSWREYFTLVGNGVKTYCYYLSYHGPMGGVYEEIPGVDKVGHTADLNYIWRNPESKSKTFPKHDYVVRKRMVTAWTNFAITGNPTPKIDPLLQNVTWPQAYLGASNINCMEIGYDMKVIQNPKEKEYQMWRALYKDYGSPRNTY